MIDGVHLLRVITLKKLKYTEIKTIREDLIKKQNQICALCEEQLDAPVLDHHHGTGEVRAVLCRGCNSLEGKISNNLPRSKMTKSKLHNFLKNYESYVNTTTGLIHPTHKEKKLNKKSRN